MKGEVFDPCQFPNRNSSIVNHKFPKHSARSKKEPENCWNGVEWVAQRPSLVLPGCSVFFEAGFLGRFFSACNRVFSDHVSLQPHSTPREMARRAALSLPQLQKRRGFEWS